MKNFIPILIAPTFAALLLAGSAQATESAFLAVGAGGHRMLSRDGLKWEKHVAWGEPKHDQNDLNVAVFFKGIAFAGGGYSIARVAATRDGANWSEGVLPNGSPIFGFEVLDDMLYAITLRGQIYETRDGEKYEMVAKAEMPSNVHWIRETASGNGIIVGSGDYGPALAFDPKTRQVTVTQMAGQKDKNAGWKRVAFGNGLFVVGGQDGLLARTRDGKNWEANETVPERGDVTSIVWAGDHFLAATSKAGALVSKDGLKWEKQSQAVPRQLVRAGDWIYGWSWPPTKLQRSRDGVTWEPVPNEKEWHVKHAAFGSFAGTGAPPKLPEGRVPVAPAPKAAK